jgi:hypothetical protein
MGHLDERFVAADLFKALMKSNCSLKHEHVKLTKLDIGRFRATDEESSSIMCEFFKNGHACCLEELSLIQCEISLREASILCKVVDNKLCPELTCLHLSGNSIFNEDVAVLSNALIEQKLFTLAKLFLCICSLTDECIPFLCELLRDERCNLTVLSLAYNKGISDEGLRMLCQSALTTKHCKLVKLKVSGCSLTDNCVPELRKALQDEHCHCKLTELDLDNCSLTDKCIPEVCKALQDERCKLTVLSLEGNIGISDNGLNVLCRSALTIEHCKLTELRLTCCSLTDECIPDLREALQDKHCVLNELRLDGNKFTEEGEKSLREIETHEYCKARGLKVHVWY